MAEYLRTFALGYELNDAAKTYIGLSSAKKEELRNTFWGALHPHYTTRSGFTVFSTKPSWTDYRERINEQLFTEPNPLELQISDDATRGAPRQDHVFSNGAWICETRFAVSQGEKEFIQEVDLDGVNFDVSYYVVLYDYHGEPDV